MMRSSNFQHNTGMIAQIQGNLAAVRGEVARCQGDVDAARRGFEEALACFEGAEIPWNHLARSCGEFVRARLATVAQPTSVPPA